MMPWEQQNVGKIILEFTIPEIDSLTGEPLEYIVASGDNGKYKIWRRVGFYNYEPESCEHDTPGECFNDWFSGV